MDKVQSYYVNLVYCKLTVGLTRGRP